MGRQIKAIDLDLAYIAGFLDGDGSVMVQVKNRKDTPKGWRIKLANAILKSRQETYQSGLKNMEKLKLDLKKIIEG